MEGLAVVVGGDDRKGNSFRLGPLTGPNRQHPVSPGVFRQLLRRGSGQDEQSVVFDHPGHVLRGKMVEMIVGREDQIRVMGRLLQPKGIHIEQLSGSLDPNAAVGVDADPRQGFFNSFHAETSCEKLRISPKSLPALILSQNPRTYKRQRQDSRKAAGALSVTISCF